MAGKNGEKWPSTYNFNSSFHFRAREKFIIFCSIIKLKMLFYKLFSSFLFDLTVWRRLETAYYFWLNIIYFLMPYIFASWRLGIFSCAINTNLLNFYGTPCNLLS